MRKNMRRALELMVMVVLALAMETGAGGEAKSAAISAQAATDAAVKLVTGGRLARCALRHRANGDPVYRIVLVDDVYRYNIAIEGEKGDLVRFERLDIDSTRNAPDAKEGAAEAKITFAEARRIGLEKAGQGEVVRAQKIVRNDGKALYKLTIMSESKWFGVDVDANSGEVLRSREREYRADRERSPGPRQKMKRAGQGRK